MLKTAHIAAIAGVIMLTACTGPSVTPTGPPTSEMSPHVTLFVPETATANGSAELVIESNGHAGETVELYTFREDFGEESTCSDTNVPSMPIELREGPQQVAVDTGQAGDLFFVLTGEGIQTECGNSKLRALINPLGEIGPACTGTGGSYNCSDDWPTYEAGTEIKYRVQAAVPPEGVPLPVEVSWIGPFKTSPEAQATPCPVQPIATVNEIELLREGPNGRGATANGDASGGDALTTTIAEPGVYRLLLSIPATDYTAEMNVQCEDGPLVTVE